MFKKLPEKVNVVEVGPRDGLQNEEAQVPTEDKIILINKLSESGLKTIEITSFVHPKWTPQLADSGEVSTKITKFSGITYMALVPNRKGLENAINSGLEEVALFMSASQSHSKRNLNRSIEEVLENIKDSIQFGKSKGIKFRAYLSTVFGCPYEGLIDVKVVNELVSKLLSLGVYRISLGDTIGVANPLQVKDVLENVFRVIDDKSQIALHFHDTRGLGLANSVVGLEMGINTFDSSIGGLGGCPYAPGATGNISTEDLVNMLHGMKIETGVSLEKLVDANRFMQKVLGRELNSRYTKTINATSKVPI